MKKHGKKRAWLAALAILALLGAGLAFAVWDSSEHPEITEYRVCSDKCLECGACAAQCPAEAIEG